MQVSNHHGFSLSTSPQFPDLDPAAAASHRRCPPPSWAVVVQLAAAAVGRAADSGSVVAFEDARPAGFRGAESLQFRFRFRSRSPSRHI